MAALYDKQPGSRNGTVTAVAFTSASTATTAPFGTETYQVGLCANSACYYLVGQTSVITATSTTGDFLPANWKHYINVTPGQQIAVVRAETNGLVTGTSGTIWVVEQS